MPLMKQWVEITVDEDLLIPVLRELLDIAANPNQIEVVHGTVGRIILAEVHLAEAWYQERLKHENDVEVPIDDDFEVLASTEVEPSIGASASVVPELYAIKEAEIAKIEVSNTEIASVSAPAPLPPLPVRRGPGRPRKELQPSASPKGEES